MGAMWLETILEDGAMHVDLKLESYAGRTYKKKSKSQLVSCGEQYNLRERF